MSSLLSISRDFRIFISRPYNCLWILLACWSSAALALAVKCALLETTTNLGTVGEVFAVSSNFGRSKIVKSSGAKLLTCKLGGDLSWRTESKDTYAYSQPSSVNVYGQSDPIATPAFSMRMSRCESSLLTLSANALTDAKLERYLRIRDLKGTESDYADSLKFLSECLYACTGQRSVILIDEYDVPLENAYFSGFYDRMVALIR